jgi:hypothetical protein
MTILGPPCIATQSGRGGGLRRGLNGLNVLNAIQTKLLGLTVRERFSMMNNAG